MSLNHSVVVVIDVGSPRLNRLGWSVYDCLNSISFTGADLDDLVVLIKDRFLNRAIFLGVEAPLYFPMRKDILLATKGRKGEGARPWSAGAGAQVLAINLPVMTYFFREIRAFIGDAQFHFDYANFNGQENQWFVFEALVSGADKGDSHIDDATIMVSYCVKYLVRNEFPPNILESEADTEFVNLAAMSLLRLGMLPVSQAMQALSQPCVILKPSHTI